MRMRRLWHARWLCLATLALAACAADSGVGGADTTTGADTAVAGDTLESDGDAQIGDGGFGDTAAQSVAPGAGLGAPGSVASSDNYIMISTLGAPLGAPQAAESEHYRITTSLLAVHGDAP